MYTGGDHRIRENRRRTKYKEDIFPNVYSLIFGRQDCGLFLFTSLYILCHFPTILVTSVSCKKKKKSRQTRKSSNKYHIKHLLLQLGKAKRLRGPRLMFLLNLGNHGRSWGWGGGGAETGLPLGPGIAGRGAPLTPKEEILLYAVRGELMAAALTREGTS